MVLTDHETTGSVPRFRNSECDARRAPTFYKDVGIASIPLPHPYPRFDSKSTACISQESQRGGSAAAGQAVVVGEVVVKEEEGDQVPAQAVQAARPR